MTGINTYNIGAFILQIKGTVNACYNVIYFQLTKAQGAYATCQLQIADYTNIIQGNNINFPALGSVAELFKKTISSEAKGQLMDCSLIQYKKEGTTIWFQGKLCTVTPVLQMLTGVQAGIQCYCAGKACQLQYCPNGDYIYTPANIADDISMLQSAGIFSPSGVQQAMFAASQKPEVSWLLGQSGTSMDNSILQMLDKNLQALQDFQGRRGQQIAKVTPKTKLSDYFTCDIYPSKILKMDNYHPKHAYMQSLVEDFINGYTQATILDAISQALQGQQRMLTFVPSARGEKDKLKLWPAFIQKLTSSYILLPSDMLSCTVTSNPLSHIRTPTYIYIRSKLTAAYDVNKTQYSRVMGKYKLQGATQPYRLKLLDVPGWMVNIIVQNQQRKNAEKKGEKAGKVTTTLVNKDADAQYIIQQQKLPMNNIAEANAQPKDLLDAFAKTIYFHSYMLDKQARIGLAITEKTLALDKYIGHSLAFKMPIQAKQLGGGGETFYGRLQSVQYRFRGATSPKAKSLLQMDCSFSGVTSTDSPGASLYKDDNETFIYSIGKK